MHRCRRALPCLLALVLILPLEATAEDAPASPPPLVLEVQVGAEARPTPAFGYGAAVPVTVRVRNRSATPRDWFWDQRTDGVLKVTFVDQDGLVWRPMAAPPKPQLLAPTPRLQLAGATWMLKGVHAPSRIQPGGTLELAFTFESFLLESAPGDPRGGRWVRALPPGRYRVEARYEKRDAMVPVGEPTWNPRLLQVRPTQLIRPWPGLFTGRLEARGLAEITAPRQADVDGWKQQIEQLKAANAALRKQLDAIREILRKG